MPKQIMVDWDRLPQIRTDPLTGDSVIISPQRSARLKKNALVAAYQDLPEFLNNCPFCMGNEEQTPAELVRVQNHKGWLARGFPNLYPMLQIEEQIELGNGFSGFFHPHIKRGFGAHELIVESPKHNARFSKLSRAEIAAVFWAMGARYYKTIPIGN
jgi:UDPglucose--hexose-1-phosphate uridylyltransferase